MIPRSSPNRPQPARTEFKFEDAPVWRPREPRGGWNPQRAFTAAYAFATANRTSESEREKLALAAYRRLVLSTPGLKREDIIRRLRRESLVPAPLASNVAEPRDDDPPF